MDKVGARACNTVKPIALQHVRCALTETFACTECFNEVEEVSRSISTHVCGAFLACLSIQYRAFQVPPALGLLLVMSSPSAPFATRLHSMLSYLLESW